MKVGTKVSVTVLVVFSAVLLLPFLNQFELLLPGELVVYERFLTNGVFRGAREAIVLQLEALNENRQLQVYIDPICCGARSIYERVWFFFNRILNKFVNYCHRNQFCTKIHLKLGPLSNFIRLFKFWVDDWISTAMEIFNFSSEYPWINDNGKLFENDVEREPDYFDLTDFSDFEVEIVADDDYDEEEDITDIDIRTILTNVLVYDDLDDADNDLLIKQEFQAWSKAISYKLNNTIKNLKNENDFLIRSLINDYNITYSSDNKLFFVNLDEDLIDLQSDVQNIDCLSDLNTRTNEIVYYDSKHNTELKQYITRPYIRKEFEKLNNLITQHKIDMVKNLRRFKTLVENEIALQKKEFIEVYEEWGDIMITEWSKRMAFGDVNSKENFDEFQIKNWSHFLKLKKSIIALRDILLQQKLSIIPLRDYLKQTTIQLDNTTDMYNKQLTKLLKKASKNFKLRETRESQASDTLQQVINRDADIHVDWDTHIANSLI